MADLPSDDTDRQTEAATAPAGPPPRTEAEIAREMRLHPEPARVVRLSRKALVALAGAGALALSGALIWALRTAHHNQPPPELINTDNRQPSEALNALPKDYSGVPRLGPPLPGDLGRPMLAAGVSPAPPTPAAPVTQRPPDPRAHAREQAREQAHLRIAQEREAARSSRLFSAESQRVAAASPSAALGESQTISSPPAALPQQAPQVDRRLAFLAGSGDRQTIGSDRLAKPPSTFILQAGAVVPAVLITGVQSDLPGQITAQVSENVFDSPTGRLLLIPQGSRLIGEYDAETRFGQRRALLVWTRLILPDGRSMLLDRQPGADASGTAGLSDKVNNHWGQIFKAALISTILGVGAEAGTSAEESELIRALRRGGSDAVSQVGQQLVGRSLSIQPTLTIRPGYPVRVIVTRDLILEPWSGAKPS